MINSKTPRDMIRDAFKEHLKSYEDCLDYSELLLEESKTNARKAAFLAGSSWMLEAVLRRDIEFLKTAITDQMIKGQWYYKDKESLLFFIREWVSDFESRFKKLEEGE